MFSTLFSLPLYCSFMDRYLHKSDPSFFIFFILSIVQSLRDHLLTKTTEGILQVLQGFTIQDDKILDKLFTNAENLSKDFSISYRKQILAVMTNSDHFKSWVYDYCRTAPCLHVSVLDMMEDIVYIILFSTNNLYFLNRKKEI